MLGPVTWFQWFFSPVDWLPGTQTEIGCEVFDMEYELKGSRGIKVLMETRSSV